MNEILFFGHILLILAFILGALRLGKNFLIGIVSLQAILANLFVVKQMDLWGFSVTCSDVFAIGGILALNLLQEYFGKEAASLAIKISFFSLGFIVCMSQVHLLYAPNIYDGADESFRVIFSAAPRIMAASIFVFYLVQKMDLRFFGWLKSKYAGKRLSFRVGLSLLISQFFDTVLFSFLGLYGLVESVFDVIVISFFVKCLIIVCSAPWAFLANRWVSRERSRDASISV